MSGFFSFLGGLIEFLFFIALVVAVIAFFGYNALRKLSESIREAMSNIGVSSKKQASLVNQLIDVVKGYQESEKLVMLKVSDDMSTAGGVAQVHQQSNMVLSAANGLAQRYPELKANEQYQRLIDSIQACEVQLEVARQKYNSAVKEYNVKRSSIPSVFYASTLGFRVASYLEFDDSNQVIEMENIKSFSSDQDGERLNQLLGQAGSKMLEVGNKAFEGGKVLAEAAQEKIKQIADKHDEANAASTASGDHESKFCGNCSKPVKSFDVFCSSCGAKHA